MMKLKRITLSVVAIGLILAPSPATLTNGSDSVQNGRAQTTTKQQQQVFAIFDKRVKEYLTQREQVRKKLPKLSKEATPEEIQAYQTSFANALRVARNKAKPGDIFEPVIAEHIRGLIKAEYKGSDRVVLRKTILEAENKGVPVRVNYPYPEAKELTQIPPPLLLKLPQLPKEVKFRFVNYHLLLVDTDNHLIVDYMFKALP